MELVEKTLYRGRRPSPGQLIRSKINSVVDLETGAYELFHSDAYERMILDRSQIKLHKYPLSDFRAPTPLQLKLIVRVIHHDILHGQNVLVHCATGKDRTGMVIGAYRILVDRWDADRAIFEMKSHGMHFWYHWWAKQLRRL